MKVTGNQSSGSTFSPPRALVSSSLTWGPGARARRPCARRRLLVPPAGRVMAPPAESRSLRAGDTCDENPSVNPGWPLSPPPWRSSSHAAAHSSQIPGPDSPSHPVLGRQDFIQERFDGRNSFKIQLVNRVSAPEVVCVWLCPPLSVAITRPSVAACCKM